MTAAGTGMKNRCWVTLQCAATTCFCRTGRKAVRELESSVSQWDLTENFQPYSEAEEPTKPDHQFASAVSDEEEVSACSCLTN